MAQTKYVAKTFYGLEDLLAKEISDLGGQNVSVLNRAVEFEASQQDLFRLHFSSRLAIRILKPILSFRAHNETVYYKRLRRYDWTKLIELNQTFKINSVVNSEKFRHSKFVALKAKDAIIDLFRLKHDNARPSIDLEDPDYIIDIYCKGLDFIISLDCTGESLHKRGYRSEKRMAPLNEILAAGMVLSSGWKSTQVLLDPMCGSGTILIEAAMIALNIPPRLHRRKYAFMKWNEFDQDLWILTRREEILKKTHRKLLLIGYDIDSRKIADAQHVLNEIGLKPYIKLSCADFFTANNDLASRGMIITNPPYGKRIEVSKINDFYKKIGDILKQKYQGWEAWILSGNKDALKFLGLRTSKRLTLFNGAIECKFHNYQMYHGTRKRKLE